MPHCSKQLGLARRHGGGGQEFAVDLALLEAVEVQEQEEGNGRAVV